MATDQQTRPDEKELRALTGIDSAEERAMEARANDGAERNQLNDSTGDNEIPFRNTKKQGRFRFTKKQGVTGGIIGLIMFGGIGITSLVQGPLQYAHFAQMLKQFHFSNNDSFADGRTNRYLFHRVRGSVGQAKMQTRLGITGNKIADSLELKMQERAGLRSLYDNRTGNLVGYEIIDETRMTNTLIDADIDPNTDLAIVDGKPNVVGIDGSTEVKGRVLDIQINAGGERTALKFRRSFHKSLTKSVGMNKIANSIAFRKSASRGGLDLHPFKRADRKINETAVDFARRLKEKWSEETKNGTRKPNEPDLKTTNEEGTVTPESEEVDAASRDSIADANSGDKPGAKSRTAAKLGKVAAIGALGIGTLCAAHSISSNIDDVKHANIILPLMRMGTRVVSMGSQVMSGQDIDMEMLGIMSQTLSTEETGSWAAARSIQAEKGQPLTGPDISPTAKPARASEKPAVLEMIDAIFERAGAVGSAACSGIGQFAIGAVTGGIVSGIASEAVSRVASAAGVNPLDKFAEWIVDTLAGDMVDVAATGADFGNMANYGARLAANEQAMSMGGAALTNTQVSELDNERILDFQKKDIFARVLDINEPSSVAAKVLFENNALMIFTKEPLNLSALSTQILSGFSTLLATAFSPSVYAQESYDYGFDEYGFTLGEQEDSRFDDPYENARIVEEEIGLEKLVSDYGSCFPTKLNPSTSAIEGTETMDYSKLEEQGTKCSDRNDENLSRYRFYIADTILTKSLSCYEGIDDNACREIGFGGPATKQPASQPGNVGVDQDTSGMQCPAGTADGGIHQDYGPGKVPTVKIRICNVKGVTGVNASIAQSALEMINAAEAAGHTLTGSAFRSYEKQEELRITNGCPAGGSANSCRVPTAPPGNSSHEVALAIDFNNMCFPNSTCPSSPAWVWLTQNASTFGFKPLSSEAWHWSQDGR